MKISKTPLNDVLIIEPKIHIDSRGFFLESWNKSVFSEAVGRSVEFYQDNHSRSLQSVLRGLHYQYEVPQGKLIRVTKGKILDVVVDLRESSSTFGHHFSVKLSEDKPQQLWVPEGFAHGFFVLSETADLLYKTTNYYHQSDEQCILWNDPFLNIDWSIDSNTVPILSERDQKGVSFDVAKKFP